MNTTKQKIQRIKRIRGKISGTKEKPRLCVFRSNKFLDAQIIDDMAKKTLVSILEKKITNLKGTKVEKAKAIGLSIAELAKANKITKVVFDKRSYRYHGRVKAFATGAREGGLEF